MTPPQAAAVQAQAAFLRACALDVAVRKPGNVSHASPGHGMHAGLFIASAWAAAPVLFAPGARVGARIEGAVAATWSVAGCNTNLGIVLLAAPIAAAVEHAGALRGPQSLRMAVEAVLRDLDLADARAAYRAIAQAQPGGLGAVAAQDVHAGPSVDLRSAMSLAADRDTIARQYANGFADVFELAEVCWRSGFVPGSVDANGLADAATAARVQRLYLQILAQGPDSHIVRKHGEALAQTVLAAAQGWQGHPSPGSEPGFAAWDEDLKAARINPGTTADLTVTVLWLAGLAFR